MSSWEQKKNKFEKKWEATEARYRRDWGRTPTQSSDKNKRPQKNQQPEVIDFKAYRPTETSRPYAYEPAGNQMEWVRPTWQDVLKDLLWKLAESMIAAAGMALAEFFVHRRFHPGPGVRW